MQYISLTELTVRLLNMRNSEVAQQISADFHLTLREGEQLIYPNSSLTVSMSNQELCARTISADSCLLEDWKETYYHIINERTYNRNLLQLLPTLFSE